MTDKKKDKFGKTVYYKGYPGFVLARASLLDSEVPAYLIAFAKPKKIWGESDESYKSRLKHYAEVFQCNLESLGPCVNRIVTEVELTDDAK